MKKFWLFLASAAMLTTSALSEPLPSSAKKATLDEFKKFADGKEVSVVIFDAGVPVTATLIWNWKKKGITGNALVDGQKVKVKAKLSFKDDKACSTAGGKTNCHAIAIDGNKFYEVRDDGDVHAVSELIDG